jgi:serine/threonine protein phosphatase 1
VSKWRPSDECLYVIADIHGQNDLLDKILKRILPLRTTGGVQDRIIFLGDYVDRHSDSHKVLDTLADLKEKYSDNVTCLVGNHELMMLEAIGVIPLQQGASKQSSLDFWTYNGGFSTVAGYVNRSGEQTDPASLTPDRIKDLVPERHIKFLTSLKSYYEHENYLFVHAGLDPMKGPEAHTMYTLAWDRSLKKLVGQLIQKGEELPWEQTVVCGHSSNGRGVPIIKDKYMMLDCGSPKRLLVVEANSMEAYMAHPDKKRLLKYELKETVKQKGIIRRSG